MDGFHSPVRNYGSLRGSWHIHVVERKPEVPLQGVGGVDKNRVALLDPPADRSYGRQAA